MTIQEAITKAEKDGWVPKESTIYLKPTRLGEFALDCFLLDPLFWKALGKSMGWYDHRLRDKRGQCLECGAPQCEIEWLANWHRFIDHLASGKDIESFFAPL